MTFDPILNGFPGPMAIHFYVMFGDPTCISFWDIVQMNRQTHKCWLTPHACN